MKLNVNLELRNEVKNFLINVIDGSCDGWNFGSCDLNIDLNFETISISREVYPDGLNKYILNVSEVQGCCPPNPIRKC